MHTPQGPQGESKGSGQSPRQLQIWEMCKYQTEQQSPEKPKTKLLAPSQPLT